MIDIPCIVFAGGKSSRMGKDKALLPFGDSPTLTEYQLTKLQNLFKNVYVSCKDSSKFSFDANFIEDVRSKNIYAPTTGFIAIFKKLNMTEKFFVISVDTPFITKTDIETIINNDNNTADATIAKTQEGIQPMCGIYHRSLENKFTEMLHNNSHKLGLLLQNSKTTYVSFDNPLPFLNLNNPQDYNKALTLI